MPVARGNIQNELIARLQEVLRDVLHSHLQDILWAYLMKIINTLYQTVETMLSGSATS